MTKWYIGTYEKTGIMAQPWVTAGYNAMCVDKEVEPGERNGILFVCADMREWIPPRRVIEDGIVFSAHFPPCDHTSVSGARWFVGKGLGALALSVQLFERAAFWAEWFGAPYFVENPVSTMSTYWRKPDDIFDPYQFSNHCLDDWYTKKTCTWSGGGFVMPTHDYDVARYERGLAAYKHFKKTGERLPDLSDYPDDRIHMASPGEDRADFRAATPLGFARAAHLANDPLHRERQAV
jgi:hypothetical protein